MPAASKPKKPRSEYKNAVVPISRVTVIHGERASGKTTVATALHDAEPKDDVTGRSTAYILDLHEIRCVRKDETLRRMRGLRISHLILTVESRDEAVAWLGKAKLAPTRFIHFTKA